MKTLYIMRAYTLFILFFLWFSNLALGQTYTCPDNNVLGASPCYISNGCIYKDLGLTLLVCADNSHYYIDNGDGGIGGKRTFSYLLLPLDDYIFLFGLFPVIYSFYHLRRKAV
ncbi:hypothetical protein ACTJKC_05210 [Pedobacter sp. 22226]|uniref:hypothetical protein n=1 Tax=Pedobacter sp. 22226 TaxID=3453894 RepID=UPI003F83FDE2